VTIESHLGYNKWDALHIACWKQRVGVIKLMLESDKFDPNAHCTTGKRPVRTVMQSQPGSPVRLGKGPYYLSAAQRIRPFAQPDRRGRV
jgi:hypothetical protein